MLPCERSSPAARVVRARAFPRGSQQPRLWQERSHEQMSSFSSDWLALREPADHKARSARLASTIADVLPSVYDLAVLDLGAGTGSNFRYLSRRLERHRRQHWLLVDHDAALLARAEQELGNLDSLYK